MFTYEFFLTIWYIECLVPKPLNSFRNCLNVSKTIYVLAENTEEGFLITRQIMGGTIKFQNDFQNMDNNINLLCKQCRCKYLDLMYAIF